MLQTKKDIIPCQVFRSLTLFLTVFLFSCGTKHPQKISPQQIQVVEVIKRDIPLYKEFVGQIYGAKDIPIRARVEGFLEGIHFKEGFMVKKGQLLYTIDPKPLESRVNVQKSKLAEAETILAKTKSDLDRYIPLAKVKAVSESDLDAMQAQYDAALSSVAAARANLRSSEIELGYTKVYSPITGIIGQTEAKTGDFVGREPNPVILNMISKTDHVKVQFFLTENEYLALTRDYLTRQKDYQEIRNKAQKESILELILSDGTIYPQKGKVDFIDRGINATTGSILVQGNFKNPDHLLRPGLFAKVKVKMEEVQGGLLIPQKCVMELQGRRSVYVVTDSNTVESRSIIIRQAVDDYWLIKEGLSASEKIVLEGLQKVRSGAEIVPVISEFKSKAITQ